MVNLGLTLICCDVIACIIYGLPDIVSAQIRLTCGFHTAQMWAGSGMTLCCVSGLEKRDLLMRMPIVYLPPPCGEKFLNRVKERGVV